MVEFDRRSLLKLTIGSSCVLGSAVFPTLLAGQAIAWGTVLPTLLGDLAAGITANAIDALIDDQESEWTSIETQHLTEAVGKALAAVITLAAEQQRGQIHKDLKKIAAQAIHNWVTIANQELAQTRYPELREGRLDKFLAPEELSLTQQGNLTVEEWSDIFIRLNMAARAGKGGFAISAEVRQQVAELLHTTFPKALRETLKEDFVSNGKAFAGLTLQLLTGMKVELAQLQEPLDSQGADITQMLEAVIHLESQLQASTTQQVALFHKIGQNIDSGFAAVCQQLGVAELTISRLIQGMELTLDELRMDVAKILSRVDPAKPELTPAEWQLVGRKMLAERQALTSNLFTRENDIALNRVDVYVPLGLVERRKVKPPARRPEQEADQPEQKTDQPGQESKPPEQETIRPIAEAEFFQQVLRQGRSSKSQGKRIAIIGEPGSGKTTRLLAIADWLLANQLGLPVWVPLRALGDLSVGDYLRQWLRDATGQDTLWDDFLAQLDAGRVWLLLDGLDELTGRVQAEHKALVTGFWAAARMVLSCRVNVWDIYRGALDQFDEYRNLEFESAQIKDYIQSWFGAAAQPEAGQALWTELQEASRAQLLDLIRNPLRLSLLCCVWLQQQGALPETQAGLYAQFVAWVYEWKRAVVPTTPTGRQALQAKLSALALQAMAVDEATGRSARFMLPEALLTEVFGGLDDPLCEQALRLGWLNRVGTAASGEALFSFYHATFQEYFATLGIEDWDYFLPRNHGDRPVPGKAYRIFEKQWKQVILLWLGRADIPIVDKEAFIQALVEFEDGAYGFYGYQALFLAAAAVNQFQTCSLADEIVKTVVRLGFGYFNEEKQEWQTFLEPIQEGAREVISETIRPLAITELVEILQTCPIEWIPRQAVEYLGKIAPGGNAVSIKALIDLIDTTEARDTRLEMIERLMLEVIKCLMKIAPEDPAVIKTLVKFIPITANTSTQSQIAQVLKTIGSDNAVLIRDLARLLGTTDDDKIRWCAADCLGEIDPGNPMAIDALVNLIHTTKNEWIQSSAAESLGKIDPSNPMTIPALINLIRTTESEYTRRSVVESLAKIAPDNPTVSSTLIDILRTTTNAYKIRLSAAQSLKEMNEDGSEVIAALIHLL